MFYLIGLGLGDCKSITVKGLEVVKKCEQVYVESYTSIFGTTLEDLEIFYDRPLLIANRQLVEEGCTEILDNAKTKDIALLVIGDPFGATTHTDLMLRAKEKGVEVKVIHNASIISAVGCCGLQLYTFGETTSIPKWTEGWRPDSFLNKIRDNLTRNLHTLCLLDIKVKEPTVESLMKKKIEYMPPYYMTVKEACGQILEKVKEESIADSIGLNSNSLCIGLARVGHDDQKIVAGTLVKLADIDLGGPPHCLVIPAPELHPIEAEYLAQFTI